MPESSGDLCTLPMSRHCGDTLPALIGRRPFLRPMRASRRTVPNVPNENAPSPEDGA